jgi:hypothetical protein
MQFAGGASFAGFSNTAYINANCYFDGSWRYIATTTAGRYEAGASHKWFTSTSGTAGAVISETQTMTLDASGNLGVGATSIPAGFRLYASGGSMLLDNNTAFRQKDSAGNNTLIFALSSGNNLEFGSGQHTGGLTITTGNSNITFTTNSAERARIDSSGNLLVGTTSNTRAARLRVEGGETAYFTGYGNGYGIGLWMTPNASATGGTADPIKFQNVSNTTVGSISTTASATAFNTSSDYRLKNTIALMTGALAKVALLKPVTYKWNVDGSDGEGFIAHELAEVVPNAVTGEKDAVDADGNPKYQGIDTSFLVATLTAALQEAHGLIKSLETRITALEAK